MSSGGGGGGKDYTKESHKYNKELWRFNHREALQAHKETLKINAQVRADREEQRDFKYDVDNENWRYQDQQKKIKEQYEKDAYDRAQEYKGHQETLNETAYKQALDANETQATERNQKREFDLGKELIKRDDKLTKVQLATRAARLKERQQSDALLYAGLKAELQLRTTEFGANEKRELLTLAEHQKRAKTALENQDNFIKDLRALGQVKASGSVGRTSDKRVYEVLAAKGRRDRAIFDMATRSSDQYNAAMYGVDNAVLAASKSLGLSRQEFEDKAETIAEELGIAITAGDEERISIAAAYKITEDEAAATLVSINKAKKLADDEAFHKKSGADLQAWARGGLPVPKGPAIPKPAEVPLTHLLDPPEPNRPPEPVKGAGMGYARSNSGMTTGSAVSAGLGVAAAIPGPQQPFLAAASLISGLFDW